MVKQRVKPNTDVDSETPTTQGEGRLPNGQLTKEHMVGLATRFGQPNGNNRGPAPQKHYLYHYIAKYQELTKLELDTLEEDPDGKLTCSQIAAIKTVKATMTNDRLEEVKFLTERELGKARQDISQETETTITINITNYSDKKEGE